MIYGEEDMKKGRLKKGLKNCESDWRVGKLDLVIVKTSRGRKRQGQGGGEKAEEQRRCKR